MATYNEQDFYYGQPPDAGQQMGNFGWADVNQSEVGSISFEMDENFGQDQ